MNIDLPGRTKRGRPQDSWMDMQRVDVTEEEGVMESDDPLWQPLKVANTRILIS